MGSNCLKWLLCRLDSPKTFYENKQVKSSKNRWHSLNSSLWPLIFFLYVYLNPPQYADPLYFSVDLLLSPLAYTSFSLFWTPSSTLVSTTHTVFGSYSMIWLLGWLARPLTDFVSFSSNNKVNSNAVHILGSPKAPAQYFTWRIIDSGKFFKLREPLATTLETSNPVLEEDETYSFCKVYGID